MGRLKFIKKTLPKNLMLISNYPDCELVLLDYNSGDGLEDWVKKNVSYFIDNKILVYYKTTEPETFHMSHAKNLSHRLGSGEILCNLDADNFLDHDYIEKVRSFIGDDNFVLKALADGFGSGGRIAVSSKLFYKVRGYEEHIDRWGHDDNDFFNKCEIFGGKVTGYFGKVYLINHNDMVRGENYDKPFDRKISNQWLQKLKGRIQDGKLHSNLCRTFGKGIVTKNFNQERIRIKDDIYDKEFVVHRYRLVYNNGVGHFVYVIPELSMFMMDISRASIKGMNGFWYDKGTWKVEDKTLTMGWNWHGDRILHQHGNMYVGDNYKLKRK